LAKRSQLKPPKGFGPPTDLDFEKALMFFHAYMYGPLQGKLRLYNARRVRAAGKAHSSDWEVFASMLVKDVGNKLTKGVDLQNYEVKSSENQGSFEYQYHKETGIQKLKSDVNTSHLFFTHAENLSVVDLYYLHGSALKKEFFLPWRREYPDPYPQRYRRSIPFGYVKKNAKLLMSIRDGEVTFPRTAPASHAVAGAGLKSD
jgi:hypothetical protein